jgi:hypothetical protein
LPKAESIDIYAFQTCKKLQKIKFPNATYIGHNCFENCYSLEEVDLPKATYIGDDGFVSCIALKRIILRNNTVCGLYQGRSPIGFNCYHFSGRASSNNPTGTKDGYIYVPRGVVEKYKTTTGWSTYAEQFRALEDYTVDGTITGDLDPDKI